MIIKSNGMTKLLKKEQRGVIAQLYSLDVSTSKSFISPDLKKVLDNHSKVFETPKGLPPIRDHDHAIHMIPGSQTSGCTNIPMPKRVKLNVWLQKC